MEQTCIAHSETAWAGTLLSASSWEGATAAVASASCWTTCFPVSRKSSFFESHTSRTRLWHRGEENEKLSSGKIVFIKFLPKPSVWTKQKPPDLRVLRKTPFWASYSVSCRSLKECGCYLVCFLMFSNFYQLDSHNETCDVALADVRWSIWQKSDIP